MNTFSLCDNIPQAAISVFVFQLKDDENEADFQNNQHCLCLWQNTSA